MTGVHRLGVRVYYEDTDLAGIVYHANYLRFLERGRTELLRELGVDQARLKAEAGLVFVVARMEIDFRAPARFDDLLTVTTATREVRRASALMEQAVLRGGDRLVGALVRVAVMEARGRPRRLPPGLSAALSPRT